MPAWLTVYVRESVGSLTPKESLSELRRADFDTLAEVHEIDEALVDDLDDHLRITGEVLGDAEVHYKPPEFRPITLHHWTEPARVEEELEEAKEGGDLPKKIATVLGKVREVVALELGFGMYKDMGIVLAWEIARIVARKGRGVVKDDDGHWSVLDKGGGYVHLD